MQHDKDLNGCLIGFSILQRINFESQYPKLIAKCLFNACKPFVACVFHAYFISMVIDIFLEIHERRTLANEYVWCAWKAYLKCPYPDLMNRRHQIKLNQKYTRKYGVCNKYLQPPEQELLWCFTMNFSSTKKVKEMLSYSTLNYSEIIRIFNWI